MRAINLQSSCINDQRISRWCLNFWAYRSIACKKKKKKNRTRNEIPTVTGARVYAAVHDITLYQVLAHHGSKVNSVLFVLPATCRPLALIYSPRCFSPPNNEHETLSLDHHWLGSNDFWNCFVSPFPAHTCHRCCCGWERAACQNRAWRAISNRADCAPFALSSIIHFFVGKGCRAMQTEKWVFCCSGLHSLPLWRQHDLL